MKRVSTREVKRSFAVSNLVKVPVGRKRYLGHLSEREFKKRLAQAKKKVLRLKETQLDAHISPNWPRRLRAYNACDWQVKIFKSSELGVWKKAGGLPLKWTKGSLVQTAREVKRVLETDPSELAARSRRAIPNILAMSAKDFQAEKYLLPIAFKSGTGTKGRRGLPGKVKADLDDGCMRSIALAVGGKKLIKVYFGTPKSKKTSK